MGDAMAYSDTPLSNEALKTSQPKIRTNYSDIQTAFSVNHSPISGANNGKHTKVLFPEGAAQTAAVNQIVMYAQEYTQTTETELFVRKNAVAGIPFTAYGSNVIAGATVYWTFLPSGVLLKFGNFSFSGTASASINLNAAGPTFTAASIFSGLATANHTAAATSGVSFDTGANFALMTLHKGNATALPVSFFVIGLGTP